MSAWIVSENHIRLLVEACYKYEVLKDDTLTPDALGQLLWRENHKSVNARYGERKRTPRFQHDSQAMAAWPYPSPGQGCIRELARRPALLFKQAGCYHYQSCEHPTWERSAAASMITRLIEAIALSQGRTIDEMYEGMQGNEPWGIE